MGFSQAVGVVACCIRQRSLHPWLPPPPPLASPRARLLLHCPLPSGLGPGIALHVDLPIHPSAVSLFLILLSAPPRGEAWGRASSGWVGYCVIPSYPSLPDCKEQGELALAPIQGS